MKELELEERLKLLEKEMNLLGEDVEKTGLDIKEAIDLLKLEIESLKRIMDGLVPDFQKKFSGVKNTVLREIDPEWMNKKQ